MRLSLLLVLSVAATAGSQEPIARAWPLDPDGVVKIWNSAGSVRVIGWDKDTVSVTGTAPAGSFYGGGARTGVKLGVESASAGATDAKSDIVVRLPARARISVRSTVADVEVTAFAGQVDANTIGGRLTIQGTPTEIRAETMNGDLEVTASPAYLRLKTATGRVKWTGGSEDVLISTISGQLTISGGPVNRGRFESLDGNIRFESAVAMRGAIEFDTHSGSVDLVLPKSSNAELSVSALSGNLLGKPFKRGDRAGTAIESATVGSRGFSGTAISVRSFKGRVTAILQP